MISNKTLTEIINLSNQKKLLDKTIIRKLVKEIISKCDRDTRLKFTHVGFRDTEEFCAEVIPLTKKFTVSLKSIYEEVNDYGNISALEKNLHILAILLHEAEHLKEIDKTKRNTVEGKLINLSNYEINGYKDNGLNYDIYYKDPSEKIAYAMSYKNLLELLTNYPGFSVKYRKEYKNIKNAYIENLMYGYEPRKNGRYNVPLIDFSNAINNKSIKRKVKLRLMRNRNILKIKNMSLEEQFMYGLPINKRKIKKLERKKYR